MVIDLYYNQQKGVAQRKEVLKMLIITQNKKNAILLEFGI